MNEVTMAGNQSVTIKQEIYIKKDTTTRYSRNKMNNITHQSTDRKKQK